MRALLNLEIQTALLERVKPKLMPRRMFEIMIHKKGKHKAS